MQGKAVRRRLHLPAMTLVVKLGSSIVAADDGELRVDVLDSVCAQVAELEAGGERVVMVTSGAIARGIRLLGLNARPGEVDELQAASAVGQGDLFRAYEERLASGGTRAAQVLLTAGDIAARANYLNARRTLRRLIAWGVVPVVNENDTTATDEITFGDNDFLAAQVAILLDARLLVLLTNVDGLHTANPRSSPEAELVAEVGDFSELSGLGIDDLTSAFGSGGMRSKVAAAEMASEAGIPSVICDGTAASTLRAAASGDPVGTRFAAQDGKASSFKLWLKHGKPSQGTLHVDDGAARVLRESGSSLLPVGITAVDGSFDAGDAVEVVLEGALVGKGLVGYSSRELDQVKGLKSDAVRELLPHAADEVIHRDRFVLS
jgi:glutamate 5-kinase